MRPYDYNESSENYLESILTLSKLQDYVRSIDIANMLEFSKPSVSVAMKRLREEGKITMDKKGHITLTESGMAVAKATFEKHIVITDVLVALGVDPEIAAMDACKMEHVLSDETFQKIKEHYYTKAKGHEHMLEPNEYFLLNDEEIEKRIKKKSV